MSQLDEIKKELSDGSAQLFDVREQNEWDDGHLNQAKFVPLSLLREGSVDESLDKSQKTYIHCKSGNRVYEAGPLLEDLGFTEVIKLDEGFDELVQGGFEQGS